MKQTDPPSILAALAPLSRRRVLYGIGLLLAGTTVTGCIDEGPVCPAADSPGAVALGPSAFQTLHALADAVLPEPGAVPWDATSLRIANRLGDLFVRAGPEVLETVQAGLTLLEHTPLSELSMSRFSRASRDQRQAILRAWAGSVVPVKRIVASALRRAVMFCAYSSPETWRLLGYDGPWVQPDGPTIAVCPLGMGTGKTPPDQPLTWKELGA